MVGAVINSVEDEEDFTIHRMSIKHEEDISTSKHWTVPKVSQSCDQPIRKKEVS